MCMCMNVLMITCHSVGDILLGFICRIVSHLFVYCKFRVMCALFFTPNSASALRWRPGARSSAHESSHGTRHGHHPRGGRHHPAAHSSYPNNTMIRALRRRAVKQATAAADLREQGQELRVVDQIQEG